MSDVARATSYLDQASEQQVIVAAARPTLLRRLGDLNCAVDGWSFRVRPDVGALGNEARKDVGIGHLVAE